MKKSRTKMPYCVRNCFTRENDCGRKSNRIWDPSSGGMGTKLKIPRIRFNSTMLRKNKIKSGDTAASGALKNRSKSPKTMAIPRFAAGPAMLTFADPYF